MSSFVSSRREFVTGVDSAKAAGGEKADASVWAGVAFFAGIALMALGLSVNVTAVFAVGSLAFICSFLYLNNMFWAKRMDKAGYRPSEYRGYHL